MIDITDNITVPAEQSPVEISLVSIRASLWRFIIDNPECLNENLRAVLTFRDIEKIGLFVTYFNTWVDTVPKKLWTSEHLYCAIGEVDTITALFNSQLDEVDTSTAPSNSQPDEAKIASPEPTEVSCAGLFTTVVNDLLESSKGMRFGDKRPVVRTLPSVLITTIYKDIFAIMRAAGMNIEENNTRVQSCIGTISRVSFSPGGKESVDFEPYSEKFAAEVAILKKLNERFENYVRVYVDEHLANMPHCLLEVDDSEVQRVEKVLATYVATGYKITRPSASDANVFVIYK